MPNIETCICGFAMTKSLSHFWNEKMLFNICLWRCLQSLRRLKLTKNASFFHQFFFNQLPTKRIQSVFEGPSTRKLIEWCRRYIFGICKMHVKCGFWSQKSEAQLKIFGLPQMNFLYFRTLKSCSFIRLIRTSSEPAFLRMNFSKYRTNLLKNPYVNLFLNNQFNFQMKILLEMDIPPRNGWAKFFKGEVIIHFFIWEDSNQLILDLAKTISLIDLEGRFVIQRLWYEFSEIL